MILWYSISKFLIKRGIRGAVAAVFFLFLIALAGPLRAEITPSRVLVIYNASWTSDEDGSGVQDSLQAADYYMQKRGIPEANKLGLAVTVSENYGTNYAKFQSEMAAPIKAKLAELGALNIDVLLLVYGVPLTVADGDGASVAVDNTLMALNYWNTVTNNINWYSNIYLETTPGFNADKAHFDHSLYKFSGTEMYLVSRIDGPYHVNSALEIMDQTLYAEKYVSPEAGYYKGNYFVDSRFGQTGGKYDDAYLSTNTSVTSGSYSSYADGDLNMAYAEHYALQFNALYPGGGFPLKWENTASDAEIGAPGALYSDGTSGLSAPRALFYGGWYNYNNYNDAFEWLPGSIACDLNSNSLSSMRSASNFGTSSLRRGASAVCGVVGEPYLNGHPRPNILLYYLLQGYCFAEASALSTPSVGWKPINVGDPLYMPVRSGKALALDASPPALAAGYPQCAVYISSAVIKILIDDTSVPEVARVSLEYGKDTSYESTLSSVQGYWRRHTFTLTSIESTTTYHYRFRLEDPSGNITTTNDNTFTSATVLPIVSMACPDSACSEDAADTAFIRISRTGSTASPLTVYISTSGTGCTDFVPFSFQAVIPAGAEYIDQYINGLDDVFQEPRETLTAAVSAAPAYTIMPGAGSASITVYDNDTVSVFASAPIAVKPSTPGSFTFTRLGDTSQPLSVDYSVSGSAIAGSDFVAISTSVVIAAGSASSTTAVMPLPGAVADRTIKVTLNYYAPAYYPALPDNATVLIADAADSVPTVSISIADGSAAEGASETGSFIITRTSATPSPLNVNLSISGTASNGTDYVAISTFVVIPAAQASAVINITPIDDAVPESNETVTVAFVSGPAYSFAPNPEDRQTLTIVDNDTIVPEVNVIAADPNAGEAGDTGTFVISRTGADANSLTVYLTMSGSAGLSDYVGLGSKVTIPAGASSLALTVVPLQDSLWEPLETITLTVAMPGTFTYIVGSSAAATIELSDDDSAVDISSPTITAFSVPSAASSLTVSISTFAAADDTGVTGYMLNESASLPAINDPNWTPFAVLSYTFASPGSKTLYAWAKDALGHISASSSSAVNITLIDVSSPTVTRFALPASASSLIVGISTFAAADNVGVSGYMLKESSAVPPPGDSRWTALAPSTYTFDTAGTKTLYAWARDAAGNVSTSSGSVVTINMPDISSPTVTRFALVPSAFSLTVAVSTFAAVDNIGVTGYMLTESASRPAAGALGWAMPAPSIFVFTSTGTKTLRAWARDAAGNVSTSSSSVVNIPFIDISSPTVTSFALPAQAASLTVAISAFAAVDNGVVAGYLLSESSSRPAADNSGWLSVVPASYTFSMAGTRTLYAWAKDGVGNVSASSSSAVTIILPDLTAPVITVLTEPPANIGMLGNKIVFKARIEDPENPQSASFVYRLDAAAAVTVNFSASTATFAEVDLKDIVTNNTDISYYWQSTNIAALTAATSTRTITVSQLTSAAGITSGVITVLDGNPDDGMTSVSIPQNALDAPADIAITQCDPLSVPAGNSPAQAGPPLCVYDFAPEGLVFKKPVIINLLYADALAATEPALRLFWLDRGEWRLIGGKADITGKTVSASVMHFSRYALFPVLSLTLADYRPMEHIITPAGSPGKNDFAQFPLSGDFTITIYDVSGAPVRTLDNGNNIWRGEKDDGQIVESGVYIYQIKTADIFVSGTIAVAK